MIFGGKKANRIKSYNDHFHFLMYWSNYLLLPLPARGPYTKGTTVGRSNYFKILKPELDPAVFTTGLFSYWANIFS